MGGDRSEAFQEYVVVPEICATKVRATYPPPIFRIVLMIIQFLPQIPCNVTLPQAAAVSDSFVTAYDALRTEMGLAIPLEPTARARERDEVVVVWGGASVTGIYAIQVCLLFSLFPPPPSAGWELTRGSGEEQILRVAGYKRIVAIASKKHHAYLTSLGASHTVSYSSPTVTQDVLSLLLPGKTHVDAVLDCIADADLTLPHVARLVGKKGVVGVLIPVRTGGRGKVDSVVSAVPDEVRNLFEEGVKVVGLTSFMYESRVSPQKHCARGRVVFLNSGTLFLLRLAFRRTPRWRGCCSLSSFETGWLLERSSLRLTDSFGGPTWSSGLGGVCAS